MMLNDIGFKCHNCGTTWEPCRCDELKEGGHFAPGPYVRCVECKETQYLPEINHQAASKGLGVSE